MPEVFEVNPEYIDMNLNQLAEIQYGAMMDPTLAAEQSDVQSSDSILASMFGTNAMSQAKQKLQDTKYIGGMSIADVNELAAQSDYDSLFPNLGVNFFDKEFYGPAKASEFLKTLTDIQMDAVSGAGIPAYWDPTFEIIMSSYSKIALFTDATVFPTKSGDDYLLNILALSTQKFLQKGGKLFTASQFSSNMAGGAFLDIFPLESLVFSSGQARLTNDSTLAPLQPGFPSLQPQNIVLGITPIVPSADATALYNGQITKIAGWNGATTMGATRTQNGSINQVFVALPLHVFNRPTNHGGVLLDHVFNAVF